MASIRVSTYYPISMILWKKAHLSFRTFDMALFKVGFGVVFFAPKSLFMVADELGV